VSRPLFTWEELWSVNPRPRGGRGDRQGRGVKSPSSGSQLVGVATRD